MGDESEIYKAPEGETEKSEGVKLKPLSPERQREIERELSSIRGVADPNKGMRYFLIALALLFVGGIVLFVMTTIWDSKISIARHNFLFVYKRYIGLKAMGPGHNKVGVVDNMDLLLSAERDIKSAMKIFPNNVESHYLLYNIYVLQLLVMEEEKRVFMGAYFSENLVNNARKGQETALRDLERVDPGLVKCEKFKSKYLNMSKSDINQALNRIFYK